MPRESIGGVTEWEMGEDVEWAYEIALSFLHAALGDPPTGCELCVVESDHELGSYPELAIIWSVGVSEPWDYIREAAYTVLSKAMDENILKQVQAAISAKRTKITPEEAKELAARAVRFKKERGRLPSIISTDAWEQRLAEGAAAFMRHKEEGRYV